MLTGNNSNMMAHLPSRHHVSNTLAPESDFRGSTQLAKQQRATGHSPMGTPHGAPPSPSCFLQDQGMVRCGRKSSQTQLCAPTLAGRKNGVTGAESGLGPKWWGSTSAGPQNHQCVDGQYLRYDAK